MALGVALLARLAFHVWLRATDPLFGWPVNDEAFFLQWARDVAHRPWDAASWRLPFWQPPGCMVIQALMIRAGLDVSGMIVLQQGVGAATAVLVFALARAYFPRAAPWRAVLASALYSVCPAVLYYEVKLLKPVWVLFFLASALWIAREQRVRPRCAAAGILIAAAILVESSVALALPGLAWPLRRNAREAAALLLACAACLVPVAAANSRAAGRGVFVSCNGGINLYLGNNPRWVETVNTLAGWRWADLVHRHGTPSHRAEPAFATEAIGYARREPGAAARGLAAKLCAALSWRELPRDAGVPCPDILLPWAQVMNAASITALLAWPWHRWRSRIPLLAACAAALAISVLFFPTSRYRLPLLLVGVLLLAHHRWTWPRAGFAVLLAAGTAAAGILVPRWVDFDAWAAFREKEVAMRRMEEGRWSDAGRHFETAASRARLLETVQLLAHYRADVERDARAALPLFLECTRLEPRCPEPYFHAALIERRMGRADAAAQHLDRYLALREFHRYGDRDDTERLVAALYFAALLPRQEERDRASLDRVRALRARLPEIEGDVRRRQNLGRQLEETELRLMVRRAAT